MCGIIGFASVKGVPWSLDLLEAARDKLTSRGPDSAGSFIDSSVYLGFRRLAILDLSPSANQPMRDGNDDCVIVFNGEIYNCGELKRDPKVRTYQFKTHSDTEVLLALYRQYGPAMLGRLNGMFALAIYDRRRGKIVLARDRFGKKPLFYSMTGGTLGFASELKALRHLPRFRTGLDLDALNLYFRLGWVPNTCCIFDGVKKLEPGTWLSYDIGASGVETPVSFWSFPEPVYKKHTENEWLDRIEELLEDATRIRLRADVPVGCFLSGGIDSGLVTAAASRAGLSPMAITIGFPGWEHDESALAKQTAEHLGVSFTNLSLDLASGGLSEAVLRYFDEPFADSSAHPTSALCKKARECVTVALSGDGGDEVFGGYRHHVKAWRFRYLDQIPQSLRRLSSTVGLGVFRHEGYSRRVMRRLGENVAIWGAGCTLDPGSTSFDAYLRPELRSATPLQDLPSFVQMGVRKGLHPLEAAQRFDLRLYMLDDILVKVDRMSMMHSLEVRSPFLDYRLVELALRIPPRLRVKHGRNKHLLRLLAEKRLPKAVAHAPKEGFGIPLRKWLFESEKTKRFKEIVLDCDYSGYQPTMAGAAERLWKDAQERDEIVPLLYSVLVFKIWQKANA